MKKILLSTLFAGLISVFGFSLPVFASDSVDDTSEVSNVLGETYEYEYNGVDIETNVKKTESELKELYESAINPTNSSIIQREDPGDGTVIETPPNYRTYTHWALNTTINATISYYARWIPSRLTKSFKSNFVAASLTGFVEVPETYVGSWVSSYWSNHHQERRYEATLIHYNTPYSNPKNIEVYDVTRFY